MSCNEQQCKNQTKSSKMKYLLVGLVSGILLASKYESVRQYTDSMTTSVKDYSNEIMKNEKVVILKEKLIDMLTNNKLVKSQKFLELYQSMLTFLSKMKVEK